MMFPAVSAILALLAFCPCNVSAAPGEVRSRAIVKVGAAATLVQEPRVANKLV
jgi:hypothetical protein